ncbi:hypothetical protein GJV07_15350 [Enterobacteriaceae bacterium RIT711]|nr:hypothetical protein [Enterobacteriaceae bacterium RIT711]
MTKNLSARLSALMQEDSVPMSDAWGKLLDDLVSIDKLGLNPVGEVVSWGENIPARQGVNRQVDFRWLNLDVLPGTKLYALPPFQAVTESDEKCRHEFVCQWHSHGSAFGYQCRICGELESNTEKCHK